MPDFSDTVRETMRAKRAQPLGARPSSTREDTPVDLGSGPRGLMPTRGESVNDHLRRRAAELRHVEHVTIPRSR